MFFPDQRGHTAVELPFLAHFSYRSCRPEPIFPKITFLNCGRALYSVMVLRVRTPIISVIVLNESIYPRITYRVRGKGFGMVHPGLHF